MALLEKFVLKLLKKSWYSADLCVITGLSCLDTFGVLGNLPHTALSSFSFLAFAEDKSIFLP